MNNKKKTEPYFKKYLWISVGLHLLFLVFFSGVFDFHQEEIIVPQAMMVNIIGEIKTPPKKVKALQTKKEPSLPAKAEKAAAEKKMEPKVEKTPPPPKGPTVDLKQKKAKLKKQKEDADKKRKKAALKKAEKIKNQQQEALNKLKQIEALEKIKNVDSQKENSNDEEAKLAVGQRITPGSFSQGLDSIQFNKYYNNLKVHLYNNWTVPGWLAELDLKAQALVVLDASGQVVRREIIKSSGNPNFDNTILAAIDQSSPFPLPPERLRSRVEQKEIVFGFPEN